MGKDDPLDKSEYYSVNSNLAGALMSAVDLLLKN